MDKKLYYAHVAENMVDYFESKLKELEDSVTVISKQFALSENNETIVSYTLEAKDNVINPKWAYS